MSARAACLLGLALLAAPAIAQRAPSVALLSDDGLSGARPETVACLARELRQLDHGLRILNEQQVRDAFFPWLESTARALAPSEAVPVLLSRMGRERADTLGLRFVVFVSTVDTEERVTGPLGCSRPGNAGCFGAGLLQRETAISATVWDFRHSSESDPLRGHGAAREAVVALVLPLWLPAGPSPHTLACRDLARPLDRLLHAPDPVG